MWPKQDEDDLCPNCCAPWKCNGPHLRRDDWADVLGYNLAYVGEFLQACKDISRPRIWVPKGAQ